MLSLRLRNAGLGFQGADVSEPQGSSNPITLVLIAQ